MTRAILFITCLSLVGCDDAKDDTSTTTGDDTGTTETTEIEAPSDYSTGGYHITELMLVDATQGFDLDDDGEVNNKLPAILPMIDAMLEDDLSVEGLNTSMADAVASGNLILLIDASYADLELSFDLLQGISEAEGEYSIDPNSYDTTGEAYSHLTGVFLDQSSYEVASSSVQIPVTFYAGEPPLMIPLADSVSEGLLTVDASSGLIGGAIPVDDMIDQVVEPLIPEEGFNGKTKEEWLATIESLANLDTVSDIELDDGRRAISAALSFTAEPVEL